MKLSQASTPNSHKGLTLLQKSIKYQSPSQIYPSSLTLALKTQEDERSKALEVNREMDLGLSQTQSALTRLDSELQDMVSSGPSSEVVQPKFKDFETAAQVDNLSRLARFLFYLGLTGDKKSIPVAELITKFQDTCWLRQKIKLSNATVSDLIEQLDVICKPYMEVTALTKQPIESFRALASAQERSRALERSKFLRMSSGKNTKIAFLQLRIEKHFGACYGIEVQEANPVLRVSSKGSKNRREHLQNRKLREAHERLSKREEIVKSIHKQAEELKIDLENLHSGSKLVEEELTDINPIMAARLELLQVKALKEPMTFFERTKLGEAEYAAEQAQIQARYANQELQRLQREAVDVQKAKEQRLKLADNYKNYLQYCQDNGMKITEFPLVVIDKKEIMQSARKAQTTKVFESTQDEINFYLSQLSFSKGQSQSKKLSLSKLKKENKVLEIEKRKRDAKEEVKEGIKFLKQRRLNYKNCDILQGPHRWIGYGSVEGKNRWKCSGCAITTTRVMEDLGEQIVRSHKAQIKHEQAVQKQIREHAKLEQVSLDRLNRPQRVGKRRKRARQEIEEEKEEQQESQQSFVFQDLNQQNKMEDHAGGKSASCNLSPQPHKWTCFSKRKGETPRWECRAPGHSRHTMRSKEKPNV